MSNKETMFDDYLSTKQVETNKCYAVLWFNEFNNCELIAVFNNYPHLDKITHYENVYGTIKVKEFNLND